MKIKSNNEWGTLKEVILGSMDSYFPGLEFEKKDLKKKTMTNA